MSKNFLFSSILGGSILLAWEAYARTSEKFSFFASKPSEFFPTWFTELGSSSYWSDFFATFSALTVGYVIALIGGYAIGSGVYWLKSNRVSLDGWLLVLGSVPVFALAPLLILGLGSGYSTRVAVVVLSSIFLVASGVYQACKHSDEQFGSIVRDLGRGSSVLWSKIIFPGGLIFSIPSLKGGIALSLIGVFVAEWISSTQGLGKYILSAMSLYDSARLVVGIFSFMILSSVFMIIISVIEERTMRWRNFR